MKIVLKLSLLIVILYVHAATGIARTWTLKDGQKVEGEFDRIEGNWVVIIKSDGSKTAFKYPDLSKEDQNIAKNLNAIFSSTTHVVDDKTKVQVKGETEVTKPQKQTKSGDIKPTLTKPDVPAPVIEEKPVVKQESTGPIAIKSETVLPDSSSRQKEAAPVPVNTLSSDETVPLSKSSQKLKNRLDSLRQPTKLAKRTTAQNLGNALQSALNSNRKVVIFFLIICLLTMIHKMHMPHLYSKPFRPKTKHPVSDTIKKELAEEDERERFRECPFCKLTNPSSAEKCEHCGQYIK